MADGSEDPTCLLCDSRAYWWFPISRDEVVKACNEHAGPIGDAARYEREMRGYETR